MDARVNRVDFAGRRRSRGKTGCHGNVAVFQVMRFGTFPERKKETLNASGRADGSCVAVVEQMGLLPREKSESLGSHKVGLGRNRLYIERVGHGLTVEKLSGRVLFIFATGRP